MTHAKSTSATNAEKIADLARIARNILRTTNRSDNSYTPTKLAALSKQMEEIE